MLSELLILGDNNNVSVERRPSVGLELGGQEEYTFKTATEINIH